MTKLLQYESENKDGPIDKLIKLYGFGKVVLADLNTAIEDDLYISVPEGTQRIASPDLDPRWVSSWWEKTYRTKITGKLAWFETISTGLFTSQEVSQEVSVEIHYVYAANGTSVKLERIQALNFRDLPGWSLNVEITTKQVPKRIHPLLGLPIARLLINAEFKWYGPFQGESNPNAHYEQSIIIEGNGSHTYYSRKWLTKDR